MKKIDFALIGSVLGCVLLCVLFFTLGRCSVRVGEKVVTERKVYVDTIPFYKPVPRDSAVIRFVTQTLPISKRHSELGKDTVTDVLRAEVDKPDSVSVEIPIMQKSYETDRYRAYVSGFRPSLDSIFVYDRTEVITNTITVNKKPPAIQVGVIGGYGYGFTSRDFQPFVGIGLSWRLL